METYYKKSVNEILDAHPTDMEDGYRYILSTDNLIYEIVAGSPVAETDTTNIGAIVSVVGKGLDLNSIAHYIKSPVISEIRTPWFGVNPGGNYGTNVIKWGDREVVALWDGATGCGLVVIYPNGDSKLYDISTEANGRVNDMAVDSNNNLWIATTDVLLKLRYDDDDQILSYLSASSSIPFDAPTNVVAIGNEVWIISAITTDFKIARYDGADWEDFTAQFGTDTGLAPASMTACICHKLTADDDGMMCFSLVDATISDAGIFYYDATNNVFAQKIITGDITMVCDFENTGDIVLHIDNLGAALDLAGTVRKAPWSTGVNSTLTETAFAVRTNGSYFHVMSADTNYRMLPSASALTEMTAWDAAIKVILDDYVEAVAYADNWAETNEYYVLNYDSGTGATRLFRIQYILKWAIA